MKAETESIRRDLLKNSNEKDRISGERFFREDVKLYGMKSSVTERIAKEHYKNLEDKNKANVFAICEELWKSGYLEEAGIAGNWSYNVRNQFEPADFEIFERWVNNWVTNWAACDNFCNHTVGTFIEMYPSYISRLKRWSLSENRWMRRASAVSLIVPAKKGMFLENIFEIADLLHSDSDDMVQKGYGWMLKVASQAHREEVFDYVMRKKSTMPRTALRYAIEKMPPDMRRLAMEK